MINFYHHLPLSGNFIGSCSFKGCLYILTDEALYRKIPYDHDTIEVLSVGVPKNCKGINSINDDLLIFAEDGIYKAFEE